MIWVGVALAGALGAVGRAAVDHAATMRTVHLTQRFPIGILLVNVSGSLTLGVLAGAGVNGDALRLAGTALLGSYTTFSTWMLDSIEHPRALGVLNIVLSGALGLGAVALGRALA